MTEEQNQAPVTRVRLPRENQVIGIIEQRLGGNKMMVNCLDGKSRNCRVPGRLKRALWLRPNDVVIVEMWEFDKEFIDYILKHRILAIDMEIATLFSVAYALNLPIGAIMLVSDMPLKKGGIKSKDSAKKIFQKYTDRHLTLGLKAIEEIKSRNKTLRIKSEW